MNTAARRRGGGADEDPGIGCVVEASCGTCKELSYIGGTPTNIPSDIVGVVLLKRGGTHHAPRQDAILETGRKSLNLRLYPACHIHRGAIGNMAVAPRSMLAGRRT